MKLAKALKEKNILVKEMETCFNRAAENNSLIEGANPSYSSREQLEEGLRKMDELVTLKANIQKANEPVFDKIFKLSELKNTISKLRKMSTADGAQAPSYRQESIVSYKADIKRVELDKIIKGYEKNIDSIQEELDIFNHATEI